MKICIKRKEKQSFGLHLLFLNIFSCTGYASVASSRDDRNISSVFSTYFKFNCTIY